MMRLVLCATAALASQPLQPVARDRWCVTSERPARLRAVAPGSDGDDAELRFTYRGPSAVEEALASGLPRRQIGLKLRAADACNLLYVMWRLEPEPKIVVSVKRNPDQRTSRECGNHGYRNLKPRAGNQPPPLTAGTPHTLRATITGKTLRVLADGALAWEAELDDDTLSLRGPAGLRWDNGQFDAYLRARPGGSPGCSGAADD
jgi:hypothetical protein